jgi:hypothetical protein
MNKNTVSGVLVVSFLSFVGCYSTSTVTKEDLKGKVGQLDITVITKDLSQYNFSKEDYRIHGDTLSGAGVRRRIMEDEVALSASIAFTDIGLIETREYSPVKTTLAWGGIVLGVGVFISLFFGHAQNI